MEKKNKKKRKKRNFLVSKKIDFKRALDYQSYLISTKEKIGFLFLKNYSKLLSNQNKTDRSFDLLEIREKIKKLNLVF